MSPRWLARFVAITLRHGDVRVGQQQSPTLRRVANSPKESAKTLRYGFTLRDLTGLPTAANDDLVDVGR